MYNVAELSLIESKPGIRTPRLKEENKSPGLHSYPVLLPNVLDECLLMYPKIVLKY